MNKKNQYVLRNVGLSGLMWIALLLPVSAQHFSRQLSETLPIDEAERMIHDGHYGGARQQLTLLEGVPAGEQIRVERLRLVCDYYLAVPGTDVRIQDFVRRNPTDLECTRLKLLRANLLVHQGEYTEALHVYEQNLKTGTSPIWASGNRAGSESEETRICYALALINNEQVEEAEAVVAGLQNCKTHQMDMVYLSGYLKYLRGQYAEALSDFQIVANEADYERNMPVYMADCYLHTGQPGKALSLLNNQLPLMAGHMADIDKTYMGETNRIRGEAYYDQGSYTKAIEALERYAYDTTEPRRTALYKLGMSYMNIQEYAKAAPLLSSSAAICTDEMAQSAWLNAGVCYVFSQNKKQAQIAFQQASELNANPTMQEEALYNYALTLHEGNTMGFGESVGVFERFLNQFPNSKYASSVGKHLSEVYFTTRNYKAALESINKIKNPSTEILQAKQRVIYNLGVQDFMNGNHAGTIAYMEQAIALGSTEAYYLRGESYYRQARYAQAVTDLRKYTQTASRNAPNYTQALYTLGYAYFNQKNYTQARQMFNNFVGMQKAGSDTRLKADALNRMADCLYTNRQYDEAYQTYQKAIDTDRQMGDYALYQQAFIEGLRGNYTHKVELLGQMAETYTASPYGADALYEKGRAYVQTGASGQALQTFADLINQYPHSQRARSAGNEMGMIYFEAGNTEEALKAYNRVINTYPNTAEAQTALANLKDIYTDLGRVNDYAALAQKAGKSLSSAELDQMVSDAAVRSMQNGDYQRAQQYYNQLSQQTQQTDVQLSALEGSMRSSFAMADYNATTQAATKILMSQKASPEIIGEALIYRAESNLATGNASEGVKDLQTLAADDKTVYGAQANVRLAQYAFDTNQYTAAEQLLTKFIDSGTTHQYWLARAFILLADVYMKTDRAVEAREYLLSLKSNYNENEEINKMIEERLK
ncbi:MAG: tetratricopeptide repeat protein [Bacteroidaceae bacterium]|nr:tetratricopeptide repeat protein [Bacteroidaceae bacterium]